MKKVCIEEVFCIIVLREACGYFGERQDFETDGCLKSIRNRLPKLEYVTFSATGTKMELKILL